MPNRRPSRKNLLIAFDAFGTLFTPRAPIGALYGEIARKHGICSDVLDEEIMSSFKKAYKHNAKERPNFGKEVGMDPTAWWSSLITETFTPFLPASSAHQSPTAPPTLPHRLIPDLLTRFASRDGYTLYDDVIPLFTSLRAARSSSSSSSRSRDTATPTPTTATDRRKIVTAVLTNSDDRVAGILRSFGLRVGYTDPKTVEQIAVATARSSSSSSSSGLLQMPPPPPPPPPPTTTTTTTTLVEKKEGGGGGVDAMGENDVDFVLTSYDCGYEKPHRAIFDAARRLALARYGDGAGEVGKERDGREEDHGDVGEWETVYVGDEVDKDVVGAENAGWSPAFLVDREGLVRDAGDAVRRQDMGSEGEQEVRVLRDLRELERYVLG